MSDAKSKLRPAIRLALTVAAGSVTACSSAHAQEREEEQAQAQERPGDLWRCSARNAHYRERESAVSPITRAVSGMLVFHSVSPGPEWASGVAVHFMSVAAEPAMNLDNGIEAVVRDGETGRIDILAVVDGERRRLGSYPAGTPVPFKVIFGDASGTVTLESGEFAMLVKPVRRLRPYFVMRCSGVDVSFADFDTQP